MVSTGYFARTDRQWLFNKVHAVDNGVPICGTRVGARSEYLWCSHGYDKDYINCQKCLRVLENAMACPHCGKIIKLR